MAGIGYLFGAISLVVKAALGYNQRQVAVLGDAKDLRDCFGFFAGLFNALCLFTVWETAARTRCMREAVRRARCTRQAGAGHRRRDRPHPTASLGGADAGEHARGSLHGALERRGACLLLIEDDRALLAPTHCVAHDLGGAQRHVEHGQSALQAVEWQLLHHVEHRRDAAHAGHRLLVEEEARPQRAASEVTLPSVSWNRMKRSTTYHSWLATDYVFIYVSRLDETIYTTRQLNQSIVRDLSIQQSRIYHFYL
jgi:hypothetical protein